MKRGDVECEYFLVNQTCKAIFENEDGKAVREKSCRNQLKNTCCYLCKHQESCEISCNYLDKTEGFPRYRKNIGKEIAKRKKAIERVSVFFAEGKINEHSYLTSVSKLEREIEKLTKLKHSPEISQIDSQNHDNDETVFVEKPSGLWYLVPFFFLIIGGLVAYVGTKDRDEDMAVGLLMFGIIWFIILFVLTWFVFL